MLEFGSSCLFHVKTLDVKPYVICFGFKNLKKCKLVRLNMAQFHWSLSNFCSYYNEALKTKLKLKSNARGFSKQVWLASNEFMCEN
jgi:hypothetical protein